MERAIITLLNEQTISRAAATAEVGQRTQDEVAAEHADLPTGNTREADRWMLQVKRLKDLSIDAIGPASPQDTAATDRGEALKQKVLKRAEQIRRAWKDVPQAPAPKPDHTEEPDETGALEDEETREAA